MAFFAALIPAALQLMQGIQQKNQAGIPHPSNIGAMGQQQQQLPIDFINQIVSAFRGRGGISDSYQPTGQQSFGQGGSLMGGVEQQVGGPGIEQTIGSLLGGQTNESPLSSALGGGNSSSIQGLLNILPKQNQQNSIQDQIAKLLASNQASGYF